MEALKRIQRRGRESEKNIDIDYLQQLHAAHESYYGSLAGRKFCIDASQSTDAIVAAVNAVINKTLNQ